MIPLRNTFALLAAKALIKILRMLGSGGTTLPGLFAAYVSPNLSAYLAQKYTKGIVVITGTNGKTTTARIANEILKKGGFKTVQNRSGSNLERGVLTAMIEGCAINGTPSGEVGIFEIDEAAMGALGKKLTPKIVLVTNLFRDQLDRYGELDHTAKIIGESIKQINNVTLILNADDPLVRSLSDYAAPANVRFFGVRDPQFAQTGKRDAIDTRECIKCGQKLTYESRYYGHVGIYSCPTGDLSRPEPDMEATNVELIGLTDLKFNFATKGQKFYYQIGLPGLYNVYNTIAAMGIAEEFRVGELDVLEALSGFEAAFGRTERIKIGERGLLLLLIKNPIGFDQVLHTVARDAEPKNFLIAINDNYADGTDISWLWDVDFDLLKNKYKKIIVSGIRSEDMALRLKYADITEKVEIEPNTKNALRKGLDNISPGETLYVMPTYTAMLELREEVRKIAPSIKSFWEQ